MGIALSLKQINDYYEYFFDEPHVAMESKELSFEFKLRRLVKEVGIKKLNERRFRNGQRNFQQVVPITTPQG